tara:strand:- start:3809 stop:4567 length:759 start_codon:yes stop_codon:yes gene_type:complete
MSKSYEAIRQSGKTKQGADFEEEMTKVFHDSGIKTEDIPKEKCPMSYAGWGKAEGIVWEANWKVDADKIIHAFGRGPMVVEMKSGLNRDVMCKIPNQMMALLNDPDFGDLPRVLIYEDGILPDTSGDSSYWKKMVGYAKEQTNMVGEKIRLISAIIPASGVQEWIDNGFPINDEEGSMVYSGVARLPFEPKVEMMKKRQVELERPMPPKKTKIGDNRKKVSCDTCDGTVVIDKKNSSGRCSKCVGESVLLAA